MPSPPIGIVAWALTACNYITYRLTSFVTSNFFRNNAVASRHGGEREETGGERNSRKRKEKAEGRGRAKGLPLQIGCPVRHCSGKCRIKCKWVLQYIRFCWLAQLLCEVDRRVDQQNASEVVVVRRAALADVGWVVAGRTDDTEPETV